MIVDTGLYLDPRRNAAIVIPAIALSLFVFAYSTLFGKVLVLAFYACWLPAFCMKPQILFRRIAPVLALLVIPAVATLSVFWSEAGATTLRAGIQYSTTVFCGLVAARIVSVPNLALGGVVGGLLVLFYSSANESYAYDVVDGSYAFVGAFASKNQLGYFASLTILFAVSVIFIYRTGWGWRLLGMFAGLYAARLLQLSDSATSVLTVAFALLVIATAGCLFVLPRKLRGLSVLVLVALTIAAAVAAVRLGVLDGVLGIFDKDTTLTGRTYLWSRGIGLGSQRPLLGIGYNAFWTVGNPPAEALWSVFYITGKTGFHFHNTLIESYVGLGLLGVGMLATLSLALLVVPLRVMMNRYATGSAMLCSGLALMFLVRSVVEIDYFTPYTVGSFLVPFILLKMSDSRRSETGDLWSSLGGRAKASAAP